MTDDDGGGGGNDGNDVDGNGDSDYDGDGGMSGLFVSHHAHAHHRRGTQKPINMH